MKITTIGVDLAKEVFQIHGVDAHGKAVLRKQLRRNEMAKFFANLETWHFHSINPHIPRTLLMEPLAIRLGEPTTLAKSLVMANQPIAGAGVRRPFPPQMLRNAVSWPPS